MHAWSILWDTHTHNMKLFDFLAGLEKLSKLSNLKFLYLYGNLFKNNILPSLGGLSSLRNLSLADDRLEGNFDFKGN